MSFRDKCVDKWSEIPLWRSYCYFVMRRLIHKHSRLAGSMLLVLSVSFALSALALLGLFTESPVGLVTERNLTRGIIAQDCPVRTLVVANEFAFQFMTVCNTSE